VAKIKYGACFRRLRQIGIRLNAIEEQSGGLRVFWFDVGSDSRHRLHEDAVSSFILPSIHHFCIWLLFS
jgi:hypothetical protein